MLQAKVIDARLSLDLEPAAHLRFPAIPSSTRFRGSTCQERGEKNVEADLR